MTCGQMCERSGAICWAADASCVAVRRYGAFVEERLCGSNRLSTPMLQGGGALIGPKFQDEGGERLSGVEAGMSRWFASPGSGIA